MLLPIAWPCNMLTAAGEQYLVPLSSRRPESATDDVTISSGARELLLPQFHTNSQPYHARSRVPRKNTATATFKIMEDADDMDVSIEGATSKRAVCIPRYQQCLFYARD